MQEGTSQGLDESQCISVKCQWCNYYYSLREINKHMLQCVEAQKKEDRKSNVSTNVRGGDSGGAGGAPAPPLLRARGQSTPTSFPAVQLRAIACARTYTRTRRC